MIEMRYRRSRIAYAIGILVGWLGDVVPAMRRLV